VSIINIYLYGKPNRTKALSYEGITLSVEGATLSIEGATLSIEGATLSIEGVMLSIEGVIFFEGRTLKDEDVILN
jgi:hypothetical protein